VPTPANVSGSKPAKIASGDSARLARIGVHALRLRIKTRFAASAKNQIKTEVLVILVVGLCHPEIIVHFTPGNTQLF